MADWNWVPQFFATHIKRSGRTDFPLMGSEDGREFWEAWFNYIRRDNVNEDTARKASLRVCEQDLFPERHLAAFQKAVKEVRKENRSSGKPTGADTREEAEEKTSVHCECGRTGLVTRYSHKPEGQTRICYCLCPMGRWVMHHHSSEQRSAYLDLAVNPVLQLGPVPWSDQWDNRFRYPRSLWDSQAKRPAQIDTNAWRQDLKAVTQRVPGPRRSFAPPQQPAPADPATTENSGTT